MIHEAARDIAEARNLLERAERETDPELESHHVEEAPENQRQFVGMWGPEVLAAIRKDHAV